MFMKLAVLRGVWIWIYLRVLTGNLFGDPVVLEPINKVGYDSQPPPPRPPTYLLDLVNYVQK
jgi:hypothetical protein